MYANRFFTFKFSHLAVIVAVCSLLSSRSSAQTFYSKFPDVTGKFQVANPSGSDCMAPRVQNKVGMVDEFDTSFTYFTANISTPLICTTPTYSFDAALNVPVDTPYLGSGFKAGFRIRIPSGISLDTLKKYLEVSTYKDADPQETFTRDALSGSDSIGDGVDWFIYFTASKAFNAVNLLVDESIIPLNTAFQFEVLYAEATLENVLPATIANFTLATAGRNVTLAWQSLTETNVSNYAIQRSGNGGVSYAQIATLPAKGNSNAAVSYGYTDNVTADGNYLYRIVTINKDGSSKATYSIAAVINGQAKLLIYPSIVKAGQTVTIKTLQSGLSTLQVFDAQGHLVAQQRQNADGQFTLSTGDFSSGMYLVKVISATGSTLTAKIMVN